MEISELLTLNTLKFQQYILSCDYPVRKKVLADIEVKNYIFENKFLLTRLIQSLDGKELLDFCDNNFFVLVSVSCFKLDIVNCLLTCNNEFIDEILVHTSILEIIYENILHFKYYLTSLNNAFGSAWFNFLLQKNSTDIFYITFLNKEVQKYLFRNYLEIILNTESPLMEVISGDVLNDFTNNYLVANFILSCDFNTLEGKISTGLVIPNYLASREEIINKFIYIDNVNDYREVIEIVNQNNPLLYENITKKRRDYYINKIHEVNNQGLNNKYMKVYNCIINSRAWNHLLVADEYQSIYAIEEAIETGTDVLEILKVLTEREMLECTIDYYFEDFSYDVLSNIYLILNFNQSLEHPIIPNDRLNLYYRLLNYSSLSIKDKKALFNEFSKIPNNMELFYDDVRKCKDVCYGLLKEQISNNSNNEKCLSKELSSRYGIPVYELEGEDFFSLITVTMYDRDDNNFEFIRTFSETSSMSFISDNHIGTFSEPSANIVLGFSDFDISRVAHLYETDSYTSHQHGSHERSKFYTPSDLIERTLDFNEMLYLNTRDGESEYLQPSYILCFDEIKPGDLLASRLYNNIPLVVLHSEFYKTNGNDLAKRQELVNKDKIYMLMEDDLAYDYHKHIR